MKKLVGLLVIAAVFVFPLCANAGIVGNVDLQLIYSAPTGAVSFHSGTTSGNYALDYDASLDGGPFIEAFCVENTSAPPSTMQYTLLTIDAGLSSFGLNAQRYMAAAWIANKYLGFGNVESERWKAGAQIAVWEVIFDGVDSFNLAGGTFRASNSNNNYTDEAIAFWNDPTRPTSFTGSSQWALAVNPTILAPGSIGVSPFQNYIVNRPVPIPPTILLLGVGVLGMIGLKRKFRK